jgi:hypothetical protein
VPGIAKVQQWNVIVSRYIDPYHSQPSHCLADFCILLTSLGSNSITSLEVLTIPQGLESSNDKNYANFEDVLLPLKLLRNIQSFNVREAAILELPYCLGSCIGNAVDNPKFWSQSVDPNPGLELKQLAVSNAPIEFATAMFPFLLDYAEGFGQYTPSIMDETWAPHNTNIVSQGVQGLLPCGILNPFHRGRPPVEKAFMHAKQISVFEDLIGFKQDRAEVIAYLEPQYQRLVLASNKIVTFIKSQKQINGLSDDGTLHTSEVVFENVDTYSHHFAEAIVFLEQFAAAFRRDVTSEVAIRIKMLQQRLDAMYRTPTEAALTDLNKSEEEWYFKSYRSKFIALYKVLGQRFLTIRSARKDLFKKDQCNDWGCDIGLGLSWCDDEVDFSVKGPCYDAVQYFWGLKGSSSP